MFCLFTLFIYFFCRQKYDLDFFSRPKTNKLFVPFSVGIKSNKIKICIRRQCLIPFQLVGVERAARPHPRQFQTQSFTFKWSLVIFQIHISQGTSGQRSLAGGKCASNCRAVRSQSDRTMGIMQLNAIFIHGTLKKINMLKEITEHCTIPSQGPLQSFRISPNRNTYTRNCVLSPLLTSQSHDKRGRSHFLYLCCAVGTHTCLLSVAPNAPQTLVAINSCKRRTVLWTSENMSGFQKKCKDLLNKTQQAEGALLKKLLRVLQLEWNVFDHWK